MDLKSKYSRLSVEVRNHGSTPALVTDFFWKSLIGDVLPESPIYDKGSGQSAFLVRDTAFNAGLSLEIEGTKLDLIRSGEQKLWIIGYVDYRDVFGSLHRSGYARVWNPIEPEGGGNLHYETKAGYNYDKEIATENG